MKSNDIDSFVIGKLPPNTLLVVKRQPKSKPDESEMKKISELKQIDEKVEIKADVSDPDRVLAEAQELRQAALAANDTSSRESSREVAAENTAGEVENKALQARQEKTQEKTSCGHDLGTLA